jgi:hypothetical protein
MSALFTSDAYVPDQLIAGNALLLIGQKVTLISGQNLKRGAVLGEITASSKYTLSAAAAGDGSEVVDLILAEDCDAAAGDKQALAYSRGDFNSNALTLGAGHTAASIKDSMRGKGIYLIDGIGA